MAEPYFDRLSFLKIYKYVYFFPVFFASNFYIKSTLTFGGGRVIESHFLSFTSISKF